MNKATAQRARNTILIVLDAQKANESEGWMDGRLLADVVGKPLTSASRRIDDDAMLGLIRDLRFAGYLEERDEREHHNQPFGLDYLNFRATDKGLGFVRGTEPADPDIDDGRIVKR